MKSITRFIKAGAVLALTAVMTFTSVSGAPSALYAKTYKGTNENYQDYPQNWSDVMYSNLLVTENGLVRVQAGAIESKLLIEYYDDNYKLVSTKKVNLELPIFGAVATDGKNFYVLTGKTNYECSDSAEVYRITKYSSKWKKLGSDSLYGANTMVPFEAGSARMVTQGDYLYVRTCHKMYSGHQANVTISFNTKKKKISYSAVMVKRTPTGYVSHSFNQFLGIDGDSFIGIDHGDAYARAICLYKCSAELSAKNNSGKYVSLMDIPGANGDNYTGVEIGGFEISKDTYIVAGNKIDDFNNPRSVRNVFVAYVDKNLKSKSKVVKLTKYDSTDSNVSTPQMVKLSDDRFIVLWESAGVVNYTLIDGKGKKKTKVYQMKGSLSDCQPVLYNGYVNWYTWKNELVVFNKINAAHISKTSSKVAQGVEALQDFSNATHFNEGIYSTICSYYINNTLTGLEAIIYDKYYKEVQNVKYLVHDSELELALINTSCESITIPQTLTYNDKKYTVTEIGDSPFRGEYSQVKTITIPGTITNISSTAFNGLDKELTLNVKTKKSNYNKIVNLLKDTDLSDEATIKRINPATY